MARGFELEPGETVVESWTAGIPHKGGKRVKWGGTLRLTDRRLIWEVVKLSSRKAFRVSPGGLAVGAAAVATAVASNVAIGAILGSKSGVSIPLEAIDSVGPEPGHHAVLVVDTPEGTVRLLVTASKWGYNKKRDEGARNAAVVAIDAARMRAA